MRALPLFRLTLLTALGCSTTADPTRCDDPQTLRAGYVKCANGAINRVRAEPADPTVGRPLDTCSEVDAGCTSDADCDYGPNGICSTAYDDDTSEAYCACSFACATDDDCDTDEACLPGHFDWGGTTAAGPSRCVPATCRSGADCDSGVCGVARFNDGCVTTVKLACRSEKDACSGDASCTYGTCGVDPDSSVDTFTCSEATCAVGRPFVIDDAARTAPSTRRADWRDPAPDLPHDTALAAHWTSIAAAEHASVASFSVVALQLLALGAPPELVEATHQAASDEIRHARAMYGLASAAAGSDRGPGPLPMADLRLATEPRAFLEALIEEACVNETLSAALASFEASTVTDPALASILDGIAADEARHATLAWRTLRWFLTAHPGLHAHAVAHLRAQLERLRSTPPADSPHLPHLGVHGPRARARHSERVIDEVLLPCVAALALSPGASSSPAAQAHAG